MPVVTTHKFWFPNGEVYQSGYITSAITPPSPPNQDFKTYNPKMNGLIYIICKIMKNVVASAAEAEFGTIFLNGQEAVPMMTTLEENEVTTTTQTYPGRKLYCNRYSQ